jgi:hypothetical protein
METPGQGVAGRVTTEVGDFCDVYMHAHNASSGYAPPQARLVLRVRVEIMGLQKCRIVGKSLSVLIMINPMIFSRHRTNMLRSAQVCAR